MCQAGEEALQHFVETPLYPASFFFLHSRHICIVCGIVIGYTFAKCVIYVDCTYEGCSLKRKQDGSLDFLWLLRPSIKSYLCLNLKLSHTTGCHCSTGPWCTGESVPVPGLDECAQVCRGEVASLWCTPSVNSGRNRMAVWSVKPFYREADWLVVLTGLEPCVWSCRLLTKETLFWWMTIGFFNGKKIVLC